MKRIVVVGGGSAYTPGVARALAAHPELTGATLVLQDIDAEALDLQRRLSGSLLRARGAEIAVVAEADRRRAIEGADVVLTMFRPGGFPARHLDEAIAVEHGIVGQETAGPGGFAMALRSVPIVLAVAEEVRSLAAPGCVLLNYTNPVQTVSEAVARFAPGVPFLGLCDQTSGEIATHARVLGVAPSEVEIDTAGTNHMTFTRAVRVRGEDVTERLWERYRTCGPEGFEPEEWSQVRLFRELGAFPSEYLRYFRFHDEVLAEQRASGTRASEVMAILPEVLDSYRREANAVDPHPSDARSGGHLGDFAIAIVAAMASGAERRFILNLPNAGQVPNLPEGAIVETPARLLGRTAMPVPQSPIPEAYRDAVAAVIAHARATAEAAVAGDRALAVDALALHPLVRERAVARSLVDAYLAAHAAHLPAFRAA
ncbi:MAG: glycoside hydrolase family 4 [Actinomycetota bacterium]